MVLRRLGKPRARTPAGGEGERLGLWKFRVLVGPGRIFEYNLAERSDRLEVHPWAEDCGGKVRARRGAILRENWREKFSAFVVGLGGARACVTIDLECLGAEDAATHWESGRFTLEDVAWALELLGQGNRIVAGDICGAWSAPIFARRKQRFAAAMDHPKLPPRVIPSVRFCRTKKSGWIARTRCSLSSRTTKW